MRVLSCLLLALAVFAGCKKKSSESEPEGTSRTPAAEKQPPAKAYAISYGKKSPGKKYLVTFVADEQTTVATDKTERVEMNQEREEYIETVGDQSDEMITRSYRLAQKAEKSGAPKDLPYSGKVVVIEKKGDLHTFSVNGKEMAPADAENLVREFSRAKRVDLTPKGAVGVGESWVVDPVDLREYWRAIPVRVNPDKSTYSAKLTKVYEGKGGVQWGTIEEKIDFAPAVKQANAPESYHIHVLKDCPIDGSSAVGSITQTVSNELTVEAKGSPKTHVKAMRQTTRTVKELD